MRFSPPVRFLLLLVGLAGSNLAAENQKLPREDVIDVPAVGDGLCVHNLFQSNMVLQRDRPVSIWGWAAPGEVVKLSFAGQSRQITTGPDRAWRVTLDPMSADSEPQVMNIEGNETFLTLTNILVGDIWILGGQSNMEHPLERVENGLLEIVSAHFEGIRILTLPAQNGPENRPGFPRLHEWSSWFGRHFRKGDWDVCSPKIARDLSAIGYVFARRLHMASQVPIGVIDASRGGTTVETWTPTSVLKKIDTVEVEDLMSRWQEKIKAWDPQEDLEKRIQNHHNWVANMTKQGREIPKDRTVPTDLRPGPAMDQNRPGNCYASMIAPLAGLSVKGVIFHQGYNNALGGGSAGAAMYDQIFGKMITAWRNAFNDPDMPFGIISLCTAGPPQRRDNYLEMMFNDGIYIREAQYKTFLDFLEAGDRNIGFASSFDKRRSWYHPQQKLPVGERISRWALATQYGFEREIKWKPPMLKEMKVEDGKIILHMDTQVRSLEDGPMEGFAIAGEDRKFQPAEAEWLVTGRDKHNRPQHDRKAVVLSSPHVPNPIHFRYGWGRSPMGNLQSADHNDLPFATQRSDDWNMEDVPLGVYFPEPGRNYQEYRRHMSSQIKKELRLADMERRLMEAEMFIEAHKEQILKDRDTLEEQKAAQKAKASTE